MTIKIYSLPGDAMSPPLNDSFVTDFVLASDYAELQRKVEVLAAENSGMDKFVDAMLRIAWSGGIADGLDIQDAALESGLIRQDVYCQDKHENMVEFPGDFEDGDTVYFRIETPATDAALAEFRAQGVDMAIEQLFKKFEGHVGIGVPVMTLQHLASELREDARND